MINAVVHFVCHPWNGTALNGKVDGYKYYLGSHGHYWEVSQTMFEYCIWQEYCDMTTIMLTLIVMWFSLPKKQLGPDSGI